MTKSHEDILKTFRSIQSNQRGNALEEKRSRQLWLPINYELIAISFVQDSGSGKIAFVTRHFVEKKLR